MSRSEMKMKLILDYVFWIYKEEGGNTREISHKWHETRVDVFPNELLDSTSKKKVPKPPPSMSDWICSVVLCSQSTMGISASEKRINKGGWISKIREKVSNLAPFLRKKSLNNWKNDK